MTARTDSLGLLAIPLGVVGAGFVVLALSAAVTVAPLTAPARAQEAPAFAVPMLTQSQEASTRALGDFLRRTHPRTVEIPGIGEVHIPPADAHPFDKHANTAWEAIAAAMTGGDGGKYRCDEQRKFYIFRYVLRGIEVMIVGMDSHNLVSAFFSHSRASTQDVANGEGIDGDCKPLDGRRFLHP